jgi:very-short-patch-repair endonuclease
MPPPKIKPETHNRAHKLRNKITETESRLWTFLRSDRLANIHFRRQHPIGKYIVDFCAPREKLIIESDGSQHMDHEYQDQEQTVFLISKGYQVLRFWNHEVTNNIEGVIIAIQQALNKANDVG